MIWQIPCTCRHRHWLLSHAQLRGCTTRMLTQPHSGLVFDPCVLAIQVQRVSLEDMIHLGPDAAPKHEHENSREAMSVATGERFERPASRGASADAFGWGDLGEGRQVLQGGMRAAAAAGVEASSAHASPSGTRGGSGGSAGGMGSLRDGAAVGRIGAATAVPTAVLPRPKSGTQAQPQPWHQPGDVMAIDTPQMPGPVAGGPAELAGHSGVGAAAGLPAFSGRPASRGMAAAVGSLQQGGVGMASGTVLVSLLCA